MAGDAAGQRAEDRAAAPDLHRLAAARLRSGRKPLTPPLAQRPQASTPRPLRRTLARRSEDGPPTPSLPPEHTLRISIVGNIGGGKTTLARELGASLQIPVHSTDEIRWRPQWERVADDVFDDTHSRLLRRETWIIEGVAPFDAAAERMRQSSHVVFIDLPLHVHLWRTLKRQIQSAIHRHEPDYPAHRVALSTYVTLLRFHRRDRKAILRLREQLPSVRFHVVRSEADRRRVFDALTQTARSLF